MTDQTTQQNTPSPVIAPAPAAIAVPTFESVREKARDLLLEIDSSQVHTEVSQFLIAGRAQVVTALSYLEAHFHGKAVPDTGWCQVSPWEKRQVGSRVAFGVGIEEVVGTRVVLVHAPLDQAHAEHARVEIEVLLRRTGDRRDVVDTRAPRHRSLPETEPSAPNPKFARPQRQGRLRTSESGH